MTTGLPGQGRQFQLVVPLAKPKIGDKNTCMCLVLLLTRMLRTELWTLEIRKFCFPACLLHSNFMDLFSLSPEHINCSVSGKASPLVLGISLDSEIFIIYSVYSLLVSVS